MSSMKRPLSQDSGVGQEGPSRPEKRDRTEERRAEREARSDDPTRDSNKLARYGNEKFLESCLPMLDEKFGPNWRDYTERKPHVWQVSHDSASAVKKAGDKSEKLCLSTWLRQIFVSYSKSRHILSLAGILLINRNLEAGILESKISY